MKKLSQINSGDGAFALYSFASDALEALAQKKDENGDSLYKAAIFHLTQSIQKQIHFAEEAETQMRKGKTVHADQRRYQEKFAEAKRHLERDLKHLPADERGKWL